MQEELITYNTAVLAKEKGFDEIVKSAYGKSEESLYQSNCTNKNSENTFLSAPTQSLLQRWLREVHKIHIVMEDSFNTETDVIGFQAVLYPFIKNKDKDQGYEWLGDVWKDSYEEALEVGLFESLKLIKNK